MSVRIRKVGSQDGAPVTFRSALVPLYLRRTRTLEAALPWLYLNGISSGEMGAALKVLLGPDAAGLSANTISRLKRDWAVEYDGLPQPWTMSQSSISGPPLGSMPCMRLPVARQRMLACVRGGQWAASTAAFEARTTSSAPL